MFSLYFPQDSRDITGECVIVSIIGSMWRSPQVLSIIASEVTPWAGLGSHAFLKGLGALIRELRTRGDLLQSLSLLMIDREEDVKPVFRDPLHDVQWLSFAREKGCVEYPKRLTDFGGTVQLIRKPIHMDGSC